MLFWLLVVGVLCLALGFVLGATFRQYKAPKIQLQPLSYLDQKKVDEIVQSMKVEWAKTYHR